MRNEHETLKLLRVRISGSLMSSHYVEAIYILPKYVRYLLLHNIKLHYDFAKLPGYYFFVS